MKKIRLRVAYDGTAYAGWQIQNNADTIEENLLRALRELLGEDVQLTGASRTDAGVHALGNVAVFETETRIPSEKIALAVNHYLPEDIRVQKSEEVPQEFHPRYCDSVKTYEYRIVNTPIEIPTQQRYALHVYHPLDLPSMREAAAFLVGTHDFSGFCSAGSQVKNKIRTVHSIEITDSPLRVVNGGREIVIRVTGNGFLYNMVRIAAGTLIEAGQGRRDAQEVKKAVETGQRSLAGPTAPAKGLTLVGIEYSGEEFRAELNTQ